MIPSAPTGLTGISTFQQNSLTWVAVGSATSYSIYVNGVYLDTAPSNSYNHIGVNTFYTYTYTVTAVNVDGESAQSIPWISSSIWARVASIAAGSPVKPPGTIYEETLVQGNFDVNYMHTGVGIWNIESRSTNVVVSFQWGLTTAYELTPSPPNNYAQQSPVGPFPNIVIDENGITTPPFNLIATLSPPVANTLTVADIFNNPLDNFGVYIGGSVEYFVAGPAPSMPLATTSAASPIGDNSATLNGITDGGPVTLPIAGLISGTTYHFRIVTSGFGGQSYGTDMTFKTSGSSPSSSLTPGKPPAKQRQSSGSSGGGGGVKPPAKQRQSSGSSGGGGGVKPLRRSGILPGGDPRRYTIVIKFTTVSGAQHEVQQQLIK